MRRAACAAAVAWLALAAGAHAAAPAGATGETSSPLEQPAFEPETGPPRLTEDAAVARLLEHAKVRAWLDRYPPRPTTSATFDRVRRAWTVKAWAGKAGQIAEGRVEDATGRVLEAWTGPQVAWRMARGERGSFGGDVLNRRDVWWILAALFVVGLADLRAPFSLRNLDLLALVSFSVSLEAFHAGAVFWSVPLAYPPLVYLLARTIWIGFRPDRRPALRPVWPVWLLAAAVAFVGGFRVGLNFEERGVIDVGYASVIGADRLLRGQAPWGNMPVRTGEPCGKPRPDGAVKDYVQANGRCETINERGDTYGPVAYIAYVPATAGLGWSGRWDGLRAAHETSIVLDVLVLAGLALVGIRHGGRRLAAILCFAWVAYPFTTFAFTSNSNDPLVPALLVWGYLAATSAVARGASVALAGWAKLAPLVLAPLWLGYPERPGLRTGARFAAGFLAATVAAFSVLLLEPDLVDAGHTFVERTLGFQLGRESPFSLWGWGQYHAAGVPDLAALQRVLQVAVVGFCLALALWPRRKGPLELAALTAAALLAFQLVLTHWFYLYLPWVFPFIVLALVLPRPAPDAAAA